jgi:hypothetical protein
MVVAIVDRRSEAARNGCLSFAASEPTDPKEKLVRSLKVSAMYAAYVWFTGCNGEDAVAQKEAVSFAREHWKEFLPCAHQGLGRLLIRIAGRPKKVSQRRSKWVGTISGYTTVTESSVEDDTLYLSRGEES